MDALREEGGHKVLPFPVPAHWKRYIGMDFGGVNTATLVVAEDPDTQEAYVTHERLEGEKTTAQHATAALELVAGTRFVRAWGGAPSEGQWRRDLQAGRLTVHRPPVVDVEQGIDRVIGLWKTRRLFVFSTCAGLLDELGTYSRPTDEDGTVLEGIKDKHRYHRLDALRYVCAGLTGGPAIVAPSSLPKVAAWTV